MNRPLVNGPDRSGRMRHQTTKIGASQSAPSCERISKQIPFRRSRVTKKKIFIFGCPRGGTTLLGSMLGGHPDVVCTPESQFKRPFLSLPSPGESRNCPIGRLGSDFRFGLWGIPLPELLRTSSNQIDPELLFDSLVTCYSQKHGKHRATVWVDHTPENFNIAKKLASACPNARFIHLVRDGRAIANSVIPLDWGPNSILTAATWWLSRLGVSLLAEQALGSRAIRIRYEDLVTYPEQELRRIAEFAQLPLSLDHLHQMCQGGDHEVPRYTREQHLRVGRPADPSRLWAWKRDLGTREIEIFEYLTGEALLHLGYEPATQGEARPLTRKEWVRLTVLDLTRSITNPVRRRLRKNKSHGSGS
jgi:hypothetical protein